MDAQLEVRAAGRRRVRAGVAAAVGAGAVALLSATAPRPVDLARAVGDPLRTVAEGGVDRALVHVLAALAWVCLAWLVATAAVAALAHLPGATGRVADRVADAVTPALVRRAVEAVLGLGALAGVVAPTAAAAAAPPLDPPAVATAAADASSGRAPTAPAGEGGVATPARTVPSADWPRQPARTLPSADWPAVEVPAALVTAPPRHEEGAEVVVRRGDTLWGIAARRLGPDATPDEVARAWPAWHEANRDVIGPDPDRLLPGQRLVPPS